MKEIKSLPQYDDAFAKFVWVSLGLHLAIVLFFSIRATFFPDEPMTFENVMQVDLIALPDKLKPEELASAPQSEPAPAPEPVQEAAKPAAEKPAPATKEPEVVLNKKDAKKAQESALQRIKAMEALDRIKSDVKKEQTEKVGPSAGPVKGNVIQQGNATSGLGKIQYNRYIKEVTDHVRRHWSLPQWLAEANLSAEALVMIDERGFVIAKSLRRSSNNPNFDSLVLETIEKAVPFPPPPEQLKDELGIRGVVFVFPK